MIRFSSYGSISGQGEITLHDNAKLELESFELGVNGLAINFTGASSAIGVHNGFNATTAQAYIDANFLAPGDYTYRLTSVHSGWITLIANVDAVLADTTWFPSEITEPVPFVVYDTGKFGVSSVTDYNSSVVTPIEFDASCTAAAVGFYSGFSPEVGAIISDEWTGGPFTTIMETADTGWIAPTSNVAAVQADETWFPEYMPGGNMADIIFDDIDVLLRVEIDDVAISIWDTPTLTLLFDSFMEGLKARNPIIEQLGIIIDTKWKQAAIYFIAMRCFSSQVEGNHSQSRTKNYASLYENEMTLHGFIK